MGENRETNTFRTMQQGSKWYIYHVVHWVNEHEAAIILDGGPYDTEGAAKLALRLNNFVPRF